MVFTRQMKKNGPKKPIAFKYRDRLITMIGKPSKKALMYCSTGTNSGYPRTWFPCRGVKAYASKTKLFGAMKKGWIMKPSYGDLWKVFSFDYELLPYEMHDRLSSIEAAVLSSKMGGGFWESQEGQAATEFIKTLPRYNQDDSEALKLMKTALEKENEFENVSVEQAVNLLF
jgi:hypothetical protein